MRKKIYAFYLPQFHENEENNLWWGQGFTEWDNVKNAKPFLKNQNQPRVPLNSHYYDLSNLQELENQSSLAYKYGIEGFSIYHYWSCGRRLLSKPLSIILENPNMKFPFHLTWANHSWVRSWRNSNSNGEILRKQEYEMDPETRKNHLKYLCKVMKDKRYNRFEDKLIFNIYKPCNIPNFKDFVDELRSHVYRELKEEIQLNAMYTHMEANEDWIAHIDNIILFQPGAAIFNTNTLSQSKGTLKDYKTLLDSMLISASFPGKDLFYKIRNKFFAKHKVYRYEEIYKKIFTQSSISQYKSKNLIIGCFVDWDNTPRYGKLATVIDGFSVEKFQEYLSSIKNILDQQNKEMLFINAWNEWGESAYLEPDDTHKYAALESIRNVFKN